MFDFSQLFYELFCHFFFAGPKSGLFTKLGCHESFFACFSLKNYSCLALDLVPMFFDNYKLSFSLAQNNSYDEALFLDFCQISRFLVLNSVAYRSNQEQSRRKLQLLFGCDSQFRR